LLVSPITRTARTQLSDFFASLFTAAFANLIIATPEHRLCDTLYCAEAWDYLRDVMLLIISHQFLGNDEPLALIISPVVCRTLLLLLQRADVAQFIFASPWTMNLCADMRDLFSGSSPSKYSSILENRISGIGTALLNEMSRKLLRSDAGGDSSVVSLCMAVRAVSQRL